MFFFLDKLPKINDTVGNRRFANSSAILFLNIFKNIKNYFTIIDKQVFKGFFGLTLKGFQLGTEYVYSLYASC